jgi:purine nucleoside phosphorylase
MGMRGDLGCGGHDTLVLVAAEKQHLSHHSRDKAVIACVQGACFTTGAVALLRRYW